MKFSLFQAAEIKIKTTATLTAYRTVLEAQIVTFAFLINGVFATVLI
jgi:hypothetical protein